MSVEKTAALDVVRVMNKHVLNPAMLRLAGRGHWAQNLLVNGTGTLEHGGQSYTVTSPTVISASTAEAELPPRQRRIFERLGVRQFLHLNVAAD